jgi:hypothetical protein
METHEPMDFSYGFESSLNGRLHIGWSRIRNSDLNESAEKRS